MPRKKTSIIGIHVRKNKFSTIEKAIQSSFTYYTNLNGNIRCVQIHTHGPQNIRERLINIPILKQIITTNQAMLFVHSTTLTYPWKNTPYMLRHTLSQLEKSHILNAGGLVIHLPKLTPNKIIPVLKVLVDKNRSYKKKYCSKTRIILEMVSQKPSKLSYETPEKINALITELKFHKITTMDVGICIDTAHIFVNKAVKIRKYDDAKKYIKKIKFPAYIRLIHLNGNTRAGYSDKHTIPFLQNDLIWRGIDFKSSGLRLFIEFAKSRQIPVILEMETASSIKIKNLIKRIHL